MGTSSLKIAIRPLGESSIATCRVLGRTAKPSIRCKPVKLNPSQRRWRQRFLNIIVRLRTPFLHVFVPVERDNLNLNLVRYHRHRRWTRYSFVLFRTAATVIQFPPGVRQRSW